MVTLPDTIKVECKTAAGAKYWIGITALIDDLGAQFDREMELQISAATAAERERGAQEHERFTSEQRERFNDERARAAEESRLRLSESLNPNSPPHSPHRS